MDYHEALATSHRVLCAARVLGAGDVLTELLVRDFITAAELAEAVRAVRARMTREECREADVLFREAGLGYDEADNDPDDEAPA